MGSSRRRSGSSFDDEVPAPRTQPVARHDGRSIQPAFNRLFLESAGLDHPRSDRSRPKGGIHMLKRMIATGSLVAACLLATVSSALAGVTQDATSPDDASIRKPSGAVPSGAEEN